MTVMSSTARRSSTVRNLSGMISMSLSYDSMTTEMRS